MATETMDQNTQTSLNQGRTFVWHEVYTPNESATIEFYTKCLNFGTQEADMGEMGTYKMLTRDGMPVCGVFATNKPEMEGVPPHWSTYLSVDDLDARLATCQQHGAKLIHGPMDVPSVGRMALIQDPQGAHIWLFKGA